MLQIFQFIAIPFLVPLVSASSLVTPAPASRLPPSLPPITSLSQTSVSASFGLKTDPTPVPSYCSSAYKGIQTTDALFTSLLPLCAPLGLSTATLTIPLPFSITIASVSFFSVDYHLDEPDLFETTTIILRLPCADSFSDEANSNICPANSSLHWPYIEFQGQEGGYGYVGYISGSTPTGIPCQYRSWECAFGDATDPATCYGTLCQLSTSNTLSSETLTTSWVIPTTELKSHNIKVTVVGADKMDQRYIKLLALSPFQQLPGSWLITSNQSNSNCPSGSAILGTFAVVNVISAIFSVICGHRIVVHTLTCGLFGKPGVVSSAWKFTWIFPFGLHIAANAIIASLLTRDSGSTSLFSIGELMLLYTARPRMAWIALVPLGMYYGVPGTQDESTDFPWFSSAAAQMVSESLLQIMTFYIMGKTVHFGFVNGFYHPGRTLISPAGYQMFAAALYYLVFGLLLTLAHLMGLFAWLPANTMGPKVEKAHKDIFDIARAFIFWVWFSGLICTWLASWLFWSGYVKVAGELYCPPKLSTQAAIWSGFSALGVVLGGGGI